MANVELLEQVMTYIEEHPEYLNMESWCGTRQCFAGHTTTLSGYRPFVPGSGSSLVIKSGNARPAADVAGELLELTHVERDALFYTFDGLDAIRRVVEAIKRGEIDENTDGRKIRKIREGMDT